MIDYGAQLLSEKKAFEKVISTPRGKSIIEVGMEFKKDEEILKNYGVLEQILQIESPKSQNVGCMELINYEIAKNKALTIIYKMV